MRAAAAVHRGADELVCATLPLAVLGGRSRRDRHLAHRTRRDREASRTAAATDHRNHLARYHRRALGAPDRLAGSRWAAGGRRTCRRDGSGARGVLGGVVVAKSEEAAGAAATAET